jgi:hypothetical protein
MRMKTCDKRRLIVSLLCRPTFVSYFVVEYLNVTAVVESGQPNTFCHFDINHYKERHDTEIHFTMLSFAEKVNFFTYCIFKHWIQFYFSQVVCGRRSLLLRQWMILGRRPRTIVRAFSIKVESLTDILWEIFSDRTYRFLCTRYYCTIMFTLYWTLSAYKSRTALMYKRREKKTWTTSDWPRCRTSNFSSFWRSVNWARVELYVNTSVNVSGKFHRWNLASLAECSVRAVHACLSYYSIHKKLMGSFSYSLNIINTLYFSFILQNERSIHICHQSIRRKEDTSAHTRIRNI